MTERTGATTADATDFGIVDVNAQIGPRHGQAAGAPLEDLQRERRAHGVRLQPDASSERDLGRGQRQATRR